jgi:hypothetical protein
LGVIPYAYRWHSALIFKFSDIFCLLPDSFFKHLLSNSYLAGSLLLFSQTLLYVQRTRNALDLIAIHGRLVDLYKTLPVTLCHRWFMLFGILFNTIAIHFYICVHGDNNLLAVELAL